MVAVIPENEHILFCYLCTIWFANMHSFCEFSFDDHEENLLPSFVWKLQAIYILFATKPDYDEQPSAVHPYICVIKETFTKRIWNSPSKNYSYLFVMLFQMIEGFYSLTQNKCADKEFSPSSLHACSRPKTQNIEVRDNKATRILRRSAMADFYNSLSAGFQ